MKPENKAAPRLQARAPNQTTEPTLWFRASIVNEHVQRTPVACSGCRRIGEVLPGVLWHLAELATRRDAA